MLREVVSNQRAILAELAALRQMVEPLARGRGPRDGADAQLLEHMVPFVSRTSIRCREVFDAAHNSPALAQALLNADIENSKQLGKLFGRIQGVEIDGRRIEHVSAGRWRIVVVASGH
jgi:hypothetical protein